MLQNPELRETYATIKLPEILSGMEEKDFKRQEKFKQQSYK
jgi:hypothetical protein